MGGVEKLYTRKEIARGLPNECAAAIESSTQGEGPSFATRMAVPAAWGDNVLIRASGCAPFLDRVVCVRFLGGRFGRQFYRAIDIAQGHAVPPALFSGRVRNMDVI